MDQHFKSVDFIKSASDPCLYIIHSEDKGHHIMVGVHVDNMAVLANNEEEMLEAKKDLKSIFNMKDLGELHHVTGYEIVWDRALQPLHMSQKHYIEGIIEKHQMGNANTVSMPMDPGANLSQTLRETEIAQTDQRLDWPYATSVGSLMWVAMGTHVNISPAMSVIAQYTMNPEV